MISTAWAADGAAAANGGLMSFLPFVILLVLFWFLMVRPQQQRYKKHQEMVGALKRNDKVITASGILGKITKVGDKYLTVEIAPNVEVQMDKNQIAALHDPAAEAQEAAAGKSKENSDKKS